MPSIKTRIATEKDVKLIKNLSWQTFFDTYHKYNTRENMESFLQKHFTEEAVHRQMTDSKNIFLLAYIGREAVGYVNIADSKKPPELNGVNAIEIARIYVIKEKIGSGVGKALMEQSIAIGEEQKKEVIWLAVWEQNQRAIQFYRRFGFEKFAEHVFMLGNDRQNDWLMKKEV